MEASPLRRPVPGDADAVGNPLSRGTEPDLCGGSGYMREGGLPPQLAGDVSLSAWGPATRCCLRELVCLFTTQDSTVCRDPADHYAVVAGKDLVADFHCSNNEVLACADGIGPYSVDSGGKVGKDGIAVAALLALVDDAECLVQ